MQRFGYTCYQPGRNKKDKEALKTLEEPIQNPGDPQLEWMLKAARIKK